MNKRNLFFIKLPYWIGIMADGVWTVALFFPRIYSILTFKPDFNPDPETKLIMGIGGSLMAGWTALLIWAVHNPIERRGVAFLTIFPVIFGLMTITVIGIVNGHTSNIWILIKLIIISILLVNSYILAVKLSKG